MNVSIIGVTGYSGIELVRILLKHPVFNIQSIHASRDEMMIWEEYPHLFSIFPKKTEEISVDRIAEQSDLVFLATPSGISRQLAEQFFNKGIKIIDLSGDLRLKKQEDYEKWYKQKAAKSKLLNEAVYGLTEWNHELISEAQIIANPGCYPTASLLALAPVVQEKLIHGNSIIIDGKSGTSGAGKKAIAGNLFSEINENLKIYKVNEHQHIPEIEQQLNNWNETIGPITFSTHLIPMTRGIMITAYAQLKDYYSTEHLLHLYEQTYAVQPFIRIRPLGTYPSVKDVLGTNYCDIGLHVDERTNRLTIVSVIDNLMKGAAGQAVQNANLMFQLPQQTGLQFLPLYP